ncbi:unnamed protein product [Withania somnifera]
MPNLEEFLGLSYASCTNEVFSSIPNLKRLIIRVPFSIGNQISYWPMVMSSLEKLKVFKFYGLHSLQNPIKSLVFPTSLRRLSLTWCSNFYWEDVSSAVIMLPYLEELKLKHCRAWYGEWRLDDKDQFRSLNFTTVENSAREIEQEQDDIGNNLLKVYIHNSCRKCDLPKADPFSLYFAK